MFPGVDVFLNILIPDELPVMMSNLPSESISAVATDLTGPETAKFIEAENLAAARVVFVPVNKFLFTPRLLTPPLKISGQPSLSKSPTPTKTSLVPIPLPS